MSTRGRGRKPGTLTCAVVSEIKRLLRFSQEELSTISGIPRSTLTKILAGTSIIDLEQLAKIASALNTSAGALIQKAESRLARLKDDGSYQPVLLPAFDDDLPEDAEFVLAARRVDPDSPEEREAAALDCLGEEPQVY